MCNGGRTRVGVATSGPRNSRNPSVVPALQSYLSRLDVFEQLAGAYVARHPVALAALGEARSAPPGTRLELAIARWDIQAHRTLATQPTPPDLVRVARTQALIATTALIVTSAAADQGKVDTGAVQRLSPTFEAAQIAWTLTANRWSNVKSPTGRTDPNLVRAGSDIRTAIAATAHTPTGWASPERLAEQVDLAKTVKVLQLGMVASVDVAHVMREVAAVSHGCLDTQHPTATTAPGGPWLSKAPADLRPVSNSPADTATIAPAPSRSAEPGRGLVHQTEVLIATSASAVAATAPLSAATSEVGNRPPPNRSDSGAQRRDLQVKQAPRHGPTP